MKKILKFLKGTTYPGLGDLSVNWQQATAQQLMPTPKLNLENFEVPFKYKLKDTYTKDLKLEGGLKPELIRGAASTGANIVALHFTDDFFADSELGRGFGTLFSSGLSSATGTMTDNILKGQLLTEGVAKNAGASLAGTGAGLAANYLGRGISSTFGNSRLGQSLGAGVSTVGGAIGGTVLSNLVSKGTSGLAFLGSNLFSTVNPGVINPYALGATALGAMFGAATGPSKEYGGKYGNITRTMDSVYDAITAGANFIPGVGLGISGALALNKGLSNIFGSTDGMTRQDAILGSAFMPAPVKWLNMWGSSTTGSFNNQSWLNSEKANDFMGNAYGNLGSRFDKAREEAGKTYGTFSQGAKREAQDNIDFANNAWARIMRLADLNELLNIRSQYMTSINNQRYALNIGGGWSPMAIGRQGMKIFNNATNHNMGMRLLSAAALIDNKQMILSALTGVKLYGAKKFRAMSEEELRNRKPEIVVSQTTPKTPEELNAEWERIHPNGGNADPNLSRVSDLTSETFNQTTKPPFTGQEYLEAAEDLRQKKVKKFNEAKKIGEAALMADLAVSAAPLLLRGFRWVFNKAGLLVRVPKNSLKGFNFNDLPQEKYIYNNKTGDFDVIAPKKEWVRIGENNLVPDYFQSHAEYDRLIASGASPEEAAKIMETRYLNVIDARPGIFRNLGKETYGESRVENGIIQPVYNNRKHVNGSLNDAKTTLNTVFHELGGHGSSMNVQYGVPLEGVSDNFALSLFKILEHNEKLRPKLRPFFLAIKDGDLLKAKELIPKDGSYLKGMNGEIDVKRIQEWIEYMEKNLEYSARAIGSNMSNYYGMPNGFNEKQLREIFTDESIDNLLKNIWNYGIPVTIGGSTAATLYNTNK